MGGTSRGPKRFYMPVHLLKPEDRVRIDKLIKKFIAGKKPDMYAALAHPTPGEVLYLYSLLARDQRPFKPLRHRILVREMRRDNWCDHNGDTFKLRINDQDKAELYDGQTRCAALWTFSQGGGDLPKTLNLYFTNSADAYRTVDGGTMRTQTDIAQMRGEIPLASGVRAGILYEHFDFKVVPTIAQDEAVETIYANPELVEFVRSLPQSSGGGSARLALAGVYAAAIRAWRINPEKARTFFSALICRNQTLPNKQGVDVLCKPLKDGVLAIERYEEQRRGQPGKVLAAYIGMQTFRVWCNGGRLTKKDLQPIGGRYWTNVLPSIPLTLDHVQEAAE